MTPEELFHEALSKPPAERPAFLAAARAGDEGLRERVDALVRAHENPGGFLAGRPCASPLAVGPTGPPPDGRG
jgi:hypothetical protein